MESQCISFREIPHTTKLFTAFLDNFSELASYYSYPGTIEGIEASARHIVYDPALRKAVVEVLRGQNERFAPDNKLSAQTARYLDRLAGGACAILTGQQVGLFSGPVLAFYKAIAAVQVAAEMTRRGVEAVPIFWMATEDHDLAEINHSTWVTRQGSTRYELPLRTEDAGRRAGQVLLGEAVEALVSEAARTLEGPFAENVSRALHDSYRAEETYGSAFAKLFARLLPELGIILVDPLDANLHRLALPIYRQALDRTTDLGSALLQRSKELESAGYHAQVKVTSESTLLFVDVDGRREPLRTRNGHFAAEKTEFSKEQLLALLDAHPEKFSANALLRPVVEDFLLPTAAYIGGPAEVAYMAQAQVLYHALLDRMPAILARPSFTLVEPPIARFLTQHGLSLHDFFRGGQHVRAQMELKSIPDGLGRRFDDTAARMAALLREYETPLQQLDPTLIEAMKTAEQKILHQLTQLRAKAGRAENFRSGVLDRHQQILAESLCPGGELQERTVSFLPLLASHGLALIEELSRFSCLPGSAGETGCSNQHHVLYL